MAQTHSNVRSDAKYPPTLEFAETGASFVIMAKEIREKIRTKNGLRTVVEVLERKSKERLTIWWPNGMPLPSMTLPCVLIRLNKKDWKLVISETREEGLKLWSEGFNDQLSVSSVKDVSSDFV